MYRAARQGSISRLLRAALSCRPSVPDIQFPPPVPATARVNIPRRRRFSSLTELSSYDEDSRILPSSSEPPTQESVIYVLRKLGKSPEKAFKFLECARERYGFKPSGVVYNLMLRILGASKDSARDFWIFANQMREDGYSVDQSTYLTLLTSFKKQNMPGDASSLEELHSLAQDEGIRGAVAILDAAEEWIESLGEEIGASKLVLSDSNVANVLREVRANPMKALGFFRWAEKQENYKHGSVAYNALSRVLGRGDTIEEFWILVSEMKKLGYEIDIDTYVKLSRRFQKAKMLKHAVRLYEHMMDGSNKPSLQDCAILLRQISLADHPDMDLVSRVVEKFESKGNSLSKSIFDGIHRSLTSNGRFHEANQVMEKMKRSGFDPDNITYSQLIYGLCKSNQLEESRRILAEMESSGIVPDLKTWTIIIHGHCASHDVDQALTLFTTMVGKGHIPDGHVMDDMVKGLCSQCRSSAAHTLVLEMREKVNVKPWQGTLKVLIEGFLQEGAIEEAIRVLGLMKKLNYPPYVEHFGKYISKFGTLEDARDFFKVVSRRSAPSTYVGVFEGLMKEGRYDDAKDLMFTSPHHIRKHREVLNLFGSVKV